LPADNFRDLACLAFWAKIMAGLKGSGTSWPGFSYTEREWSRLEVLAGCVDGAEGVRFVTLNAVVFIVIAAAAMFGFMFAVLQLIDPEIAPLSPLTLEFLLAAVMIFVLGFGFPASMRIAARLVATDRLRGELKAAPEDPALWGKVRFQMRRMMLMACGLVIPCLILAATFDSASSLLLTGVRILCRVAVVLSVAHAWRRRGKG
jgi:hypothetical protein